MSSSYLDQEGALAYLSGGSMAYVDSLYEDYLVDPATVPDDWRAVFNALPGTPLQEAEPSHREIRNYFLKNADKKRVQSVSVDDHEAEVADWVNAYRTYGHLAASLDPLEMTDRPAVPNLELAYHDLAQVDKNHPFAAGYAFSDQRIPLFAIEQALRETYSGSIGIEYMHIANTEETEWLQKKVESVRSKPVFTTTNKLKILDELIAADGLERYLGTRYVGQKRFSLEGGDALVPMMKEIIRGGCSHGVKEIVIGMAHRGRLNVLINVLGKTPDSLFQEFEGIYDSSRTGDVKYHLGYSSDISTHADAVTHVVLAFNPSHLEIIGPVVEGSSRSRMRRLHNLVSKDKVLPIVIHGDAAFAGQGVVMETFNFSQAPGYCTGGTIHIVVNNQIGFTTSNPQDARSTEYCTDVAKMVEAPIFHVNGDDPEAVIFVTGLALEFRMLFKRDVVIDLVCYRRHGHNEADEPSITQPLMYQRIKQMRALREGYAEQLIQQGVVTQEQVSAWNEAYQANLDKGQSVVSSLQSNAPRAYAPDWTPYYNALWTEEVNTAVSESVLRDLAKKLATLPENFVLHTVVKRMLEERDKMTNGDLEMNWGYAETLAYASILNDGYEVRLSGQDCGRGTFSHRHAVLHHQKTGQTFIPLEQFAKDDSKGFSVIDSVLSEEAVLAFEYGYATYDPSSLVLWEAQFGDFANGAQVVIDQFISSGEQKWGRLCGLVMLLPHGYEGQGPEHSSARLERFMQLCAQQNIQVCTPTTPAQMFHLLRRQILRKFRKPLIVMTPKSILRHKLAVSTMAELASGGFKPLIPEIDVMDAAGIKRVVLCCGKVYYDLLQKRREAKKMDVAIVRIEQLYPFPTQALSTLLKGYPKAKTVVWCQEEPQNQGVWFASHHHFLESLDPGQDLVYAGRGFAAAPAGGSAKAHMTQQEALVNEALGI